MFSRHQHDSLLFEQTFNPSKRLVFNATNPYAPFEQNLFSMTKSGTDDIFRIIKITVPYNNRSLTYMMKFLDEMNKMEMSSSIPQKECANR